MREEPISSSNPVDPAPTDDREDTGSDAARVRRYAARGVPAEVIRRLVRSPFTDKPMSLGSFEKKFSRELTAGKAEADRTVAEALFDQAIGGKQYQVTLAYAKEHLGWGEESKNASDSGERDATAVAALRAFFDQFAADKAGGVPGADEVAEGGAQQSTAAQG